MKTHAELADKIVRLFMSYSADKKINSSEYRRRAHQAIDAFTTHQSKEIERLEEEFRQSNTSLGYAENENDQLQSKLTQAMEGLDKSIKLLKDVPMVTHMRSFPKDFADRVYELDKTLQQLKQQHE